MKKKMMVAVVLVVVVAMVGVFFWWRNAAGEKEDEAFLQWIRPFYQEEQDNYIFQDAQGADITQKVMEDTQDWAKGEKWGKVQSYVLENTAKAWHETVKAEEGQVQQTAVFGQSTGDKGPWVFFTLEGTVYYNQATGQITSQEQGSLKDIWLLPRDDKAVTGQSVTGDISTDEKSATYTGYVEVGDKGKFYGEMKVEVPQG